MVGGEREGSFSYFGEKRPYIIGRSIFFKPSQTSKMEVSVKIAKPISQKLHPKA